MADNALPRIPTLDYEPETSEILGSAFRTENVVGSAIQYAKNSRMFGESDPTPVNDTEINTAVNEAGLQNYISHFTQVETKGDLANKIAHMTQQSQDKAILDKGGWVGFGAQFAAGMLDVPTLLPFGSAVKLGRLGTETLKTTASKLAIMSAIDAGVTESALHLTQDLRTPEESAIAVGGSMLLTTVLGTGIARYLSKRHFDDLSTTMEKEIPRIADGRADADVKFQVDQAADNTARVMRGDPAKPHRVPDKETVQSGYYDNVTMVDGSTKPGFILFHGSGTRIEKVDTSLTKSLENDEGFFLGDRTVGRTFARDLDTGFLHTMHVDSSPDRVIRWADRGSGQTEAVEAFLKSIGDGIDRPASETIKAAAAREGKTVREFLMENGFDGLVKPTEKKKGVRQRKKREEYFFFDKEKITVLDAEPFRAPRDPAKAQAAAPVDPELRQGLPSERWDGSANSAPVKQYEPPVTADDLPDVETAKSMTWFHGSGSDKIRSESVSSSFADIEGLVGSGVYTSDFKPVTKTYADKRSRKTGTPTVYEIEAKNLRNIINGDKPLQPDVSAALLRAVGSEFPEIAARLAKDVESPEATFKSAMRDLVRHAKNHAEENEYPKSEYAMMYQGVEAALRAAGYDAVTHVGGLHAGGGKELHRVMVMFDPRGEYAGVARDGTREYQPLQITVRKSVDATEAQAAKPAASLDGSGYASTGREIVGGKGGLPPDIPTTPLRGGQDAGGTGGSGNGGGLPPPNGPKGLGGPSEPPGDPFTHEMTPSQMAFANSGGAIAATRGLSRLFGGSPVLEMMNSTIPEARAWIMAVAELGGRTKGAYEGKVNPIAVQSRMAEYEGMRAIMTRDFNAAYKGWRQGLDIMGRDYETFSRNVSQALVRLDFDDVDPNVAKAAKAIRNVIAEMYGRAVEQGLIRKDAWQPGQARNPFVDFNAARRSASDAEFDPQDAVDTFLAEISKPVARKGKGVSKITNEEASRALLGPEDAGMYGQIARDIEAGALALSSRDRQGFFKETNSRLARGGKTGERGLDYNVGIKVEFGQDGNLGDNLVARGGLINRRYTDRVAHEQEEFIRAESMAYLQDRDVQVNAARKFNADEKAKARAEAEAKGEDPKEAEFNALEDRNAEAKLWSELTPQAKKLRLMSALNHSKGSWEFIVHGTIKSGDARVLGIEASTGRSALHRRNVLLSDEILLRKGWIDDDALGIANHTIRQISADVELARNFRRPMMGNGEMQDAAIKRPNAYWVDGADPTTVPDLAMTVPRKMIGTKFDEAFAKLGSGPENDAARNRLINERQLMLGGTDASGNLKEGLIDTVTDMIRGTHAITANSTRSAQNLAALKNYSFATRMGSNAITNLSDLGAIAARHGFPNLLGHFAHRASGLVRSLADTEALANLATKWELPQDRVGALLAREARAAGIAVETDLMSRIASQMDIMDPFANAKRKDSAFQQMGHTLAQAGSKLYLINVITNSMRRASYGIYVDRVVRMAMEPGSIAKHERQWLNDLGIGDDLLAGVRKEVTDNKGAVLDGGVWHVDTEKWDNPRTRSLFYAAGLKDVNTANVSPKATEKPLAFSNPIVNTMLQFWSFSFGATLRIMGQSAQRIINGTDGANSDGTRAMLGILGMIGAGMGTYALHNYASTWRQRSNGTLDPRDELPDFQDNWRQWVLQGFDRSGVGGVFSQIGTVADGLGVSPIHKGIRSFDADPDMTDPIKKYGRPQAVKNLLGPTAGLMDDLISAGRGIAYGTMLPDEEVKRANVRAIMRNTPFINAFYLKSLTKEALEHLADDVLMLPPDR